MYQRQEIIIKKNSELMKKYEAASEKAHEIAINDDYDDDEKRRTAWMKRIYAEGTKAYDYMKTHTTSEEHRTYEETNNAWKFYHEHVKYYIDMVKIISTFDYTFCSEKKSTVNIYVTEKDTEEELQIIIEEFWNDNFVQKCLNPLFENGFRPGVDYDEVPNVLRQLLKMIEFHKYLQNRYAEEHEKISKQLKYNCIGRYFDEITDGNGAIGVFDHSENEYFMYGYGSANYGWSGKIMEGNVVNKSIFSDAPDKMWYYTNPMNYWYPLGPLGDEFYSDWEDDNKEMWKKFPDKYDKLVDEDTEGGLMTYYDEIDAYTLYQMYDLGDWEYETKEDKVGMTGAEILELINALETLNKDFIQMQKNSCERVGRDFKEYANEGFGVNMLFFSDDMDVIYIGLGKEDEDGLLTGELTIHCKNFKQE